MNRILSSYKFTITFIGGAFFFVWSNLLFDMGFEIIYWLSMPDWALVVGGLVIPLFLLVGALQYKSRIAFAVTLAIFFVAILLNFHFLPFYFEEWQIERNGGILNCSCCPSCEIRSIVKIAFLGVAGVLLMHRQNFLREFVWKGKYSIIVFVGVLMMYLLFFNPRVLTAF